MITQPFVYFFYVKLYSFSLKNEFHFNSFDFSQIFAHSHICVKNIHQSPADMIVATVLICICKSVDRKTPFSVATTPRCRGRRYSFLWITLLTHDLYLIMLSVKQEGIKSHYLSVWYDSTRD